MSISYIVALTLIQTTPVATSSVPDEHVALEAFQSICFDNFGDPSAIENSLADPTRGLVKREKTGFDATQPGDVWDAEAYSVSFMHADWLPKDIPSLQCSLSATYPETSPHPEFAAEIAMRLGLDRGRIGKDRPRSQSRWDFNDNWRLFFSTEPDGEGMKVRYSLLLLPD